MDQPLSLDELRTAVTDLTIAVIEQRPLTDHQWDHAITTLLVAREQHGGRVRQLVQAILGVGRGNRPGQLGESLSELHCHLAVVEDIPAKTSRARRPHRSNPSTGQLHLFGDD